MDPMDFEDKVCVLSEGEVFTFPDGFFHEEKDENNNTVLKWKSKVPQKGSSSLESSCSTTGDL